MRQNRIVALVFRIGALLFAVAGVMAQIGVFSGLVSGRTFMYYTIQSNLLAIVLFAMLAVRTARCLQSGEGTHGFAGWHARFEMVVVTDILVTFVVFWTLLSSQVEAAYLWTFENIAIHGITPLLCLADYLLFTKGGHLKYRDVYHTCIFPVFYVVFSAVAGLAGYVYGYAGFTSSPFSSTIDFQPIRAPYFFLDYYTIGAWTIAYIAAIVAFVLLMAHGLYWIDKRRSKHVLVKITGE